MTAILAVAPATAKVTHLLPKPQSVTVEEGSFALGRAVSINDATDCKALLRFFEEHGCTVENNAQATVNVEIVDFIAEAYDYDLFGFENEGYKIEITADAVNITAITPTGVIRAAQTLTQLAEGYDGEAALELVQIVDWPAFKLRGFMHDVGRSFISIDELKKHIELLSRFKINVFHWHFTENQAWRFEVKAYPQLTSDAAMTRFAGMYYTQEQCRELDEYAAERGIIIIPEIDMPGHSEAFTRAMGHDMQTASGVAELQVILEEVATVFPRAPYIHIGADEKSITYPNFLKTMTSKVHSLGKNVVVWNPISGVTINANSGFNMEKTMTQMWSTAGTKISGIPNIDCRYNYTNHFDVFADLVGIYKSNIYYEDKGSKEVAGTISAYWNDRKTPTQEDIIKQNNMYANVLASAERAWIGGGKQYIETGGTVLPSSGDEFDEFADWERRFLFHKANSLKDQPIPYVKQTNVRWKITDAFPNNGVAGKQLPPETEGLKDSYTLDGVTYGTGMATGAGIYLRHTWGGIIPTYFSNPQLNTTAYAWTYVYSDKEQTVGAQIEFQNYGRSEKDAAPDKGKWDRKGSRIWLNDEEIMPPTWDNTGVSINNEVDLRNENFTARKPIAVTLNEGWNKVFLKLPYVSADGVRLNKWMFTFVLTDLDGRNAVDGLIYSPNKCLDEASEQIAATISEIKTFRNSVVGTLPGYYPESTAAKLDAKIAELEATFSQTLTPEERAEQIAALDAVYQEFRNNYASTGINKPVANTYYHLCTPLRENRYPTSYGANNYIVGETTASKASAWEFVTRNDGTYDIVNAADGTYISPVASYNSGLKTVVASPSTGWSIKPADEPGYVIITSGTVQFNQTNNSTLGYRVYNWGGGSNLTDTGCKYKFLAAEVTETPAPVAALAIGGLEDAAYPFRLSDADADKVFSIENLTIALDITMGATTDNEAFICASDTTQASEDSDYTGSTFLAVGTQNARLKYFLTAKNGDWYTRGSGLDAGSNHKIVVLMDKDNAIYSAYIDGNVASGGLPPYQDFNHLNGNNNAHIYIGGGRNNAGNKYVFSGKIRSVQFFDYALTDEEIAVINYDNVSTGIENTTDSPSKADDAVYDLTGRRIEHPTRGIYIVNGKQTLVK